MKVLLVEDGRIQALLARQAFQEVDGLELLHVATDGAEALSYLDECGDVPDLILLDLVMPKVDGFGVLQAIKRHVHLRTIPVVVFSTSEHDEDIARAYQLGANTFLAKPNSFTEMKETLANLARYWAGARLAPHDVNAA